LIEYLRVGGVQTDIDIDPFLSLEENIINIYIENFDYISTQFIPVF